MDVEYVLKNIENHIRKKYFLVELENTFKNSLDIEKYIEKIQNCGSVDIRKNIHKRKKKEKLNTG